MIILCPVKYLHYGPLLLHCSKRQKWKKLDIKLNYSIFPINLCCGQLILISFSQVGLESGVWKAGSFYSPVFLDFFILML